LKDEIMLNREVAQAQLRTVHVAAWRSQRIQRMGSLPEPLQVIGYGIFGYSAAGQRIDTSESYEVHERSLNQLDALAPKRAAANL
jgi:hypothetical protein